MREDINYDEKTDVMKIFEVVTSHEWIAGMIFENEVHEGFTESSPVYKGERKVNLIEGDELVLVFNKAHPRQKMVYYSNTPSFATTDETFALIPEGVLKEI